MTEDFAAEDAEILAAAEQYELAADQQSEWD